MPIAHPGDKVLVTGANGYIAIWVVQKLLEKGYTVRGTVRSEAKGKHLKEHFKSYGDKLELVIVTDITQEGAFDEAVKGVDAIEHTASPFHGRADHPDELIVPAVKGTVGVLKSALKNGPNVKRIVVTSSVAAVMTATTTPTTFTEKDWNDDSIKDVEEKGREAAPMTKYRASKTLAEKAAWNFYKEHKGQVKWDLSVLNPPFVFGPPIHEVSSSDSLNTSMQSWWDNVVSDKPKTEETLSVSGSWIDVRDLADAHVLALEKEAAGDERLIVSAGPFMWQEWLDIANSIQPSLLPKHTLPTGYPSLEKKYILKMDTTKEGKILGIKYKTKEETTRDHLEDFAKRGW